MWHLRMIDAIFHISERKGYDFCIFHHLKQRPLTAPLRSVTPECFFRYFESSLQWRHNEHMLSSQITSLTVVYSTIYSGTDQRKHQSSGSLAFVRGIHWWPVNSPHKGPVTRKMFPFDYIICHQQFWMMSSSGRELWLFLKKTLFFTFQLALCTASGVNFNCPRPIYTCMARWPVSNFVIVQQC